MSIDAKRATQPHSNPSLAKQSHIKSVCLSLRLFCIAVTPYPPHKHAHRSWSERHAHTAEQLRHGSAQELQLDAHFWLSSECRAPLGESLGSPAVPEQTLAGQNKRCKEGRSILQDAQAEDGEASHTV